VEVWPAGSMGCVGVGLVRVGGTADRSGPRVRVLSTNALVEGDRTLTGDTERTAPPPQECRPLAVERSGGEGGAGRTSAHRLRTTGAPDPARAVRRRARRDGCLVRATRGHGVAPRRREDPSRCSRPPAVHHQSVRGSSRSAARTRRPRRDLACERWFARGPAARRGAHAHPPLSSRARADPRVPRRARARNPDTTRTGSPRVRGHPPTTPEAVVARAVLALG